MSASPHDVIGDVTSSHIEHPALAPTPARGAVVASPLLETKLFVPRPRGDVVLLTPPSLVRVLEAGYTPLLHPSVGNAPG